MSIDMRHSVTGAGAPTGSVWAVMVSDVAIRGEMIRLGQLLKLAGMIDSGAEVKAFLAARRPRQRRARGSPRPPAAPGDVVTVGDDELRVTAR